MKWAIQPSQEGWALAASEVSVIGDASSQRVVLSVIVRVKHSVGVGKGTHQDEIMGEGIHWHKDFFYIGVAVSLDFQLLAFLTLSAPYRELLCHIPCQTK